MKTIAKFVLATLIAVLAVAVVPATYQVTADAPTPPAQCTGTYTNTVVAGDQQTVNGTAANDLIVVGSSNSVHGLGGDDCIVVNGNLNSVRGDSGNDTIVSNGNQNSLKGLDNDDTLYDFGTGGSIDGGNGTDTCSGTASTSIHNCEL